MTLRRQPRHVDGRATKQSGASLGFTLSETIIVVFLIGVLTSIIVTSVHNSIEQARLASCMMELRGIQAAVWYDLDESEAAIDPEKFWDTHYRGSKPGPYVFLVDREQTGGTDGRTEGSRDDSLFVVVGRYKHWPKGRYVFIEGDKPPQFVTGPDGDPGYGDTIDWESGRDLAGGSAGKSASTNHHGWAKSASGNTSSGSGSSGGGGGSTAQGLSSSSTGSSSSGSGQTTTSRIGD